jgi:phosphate transport system ATP-binding protein
LNFPKAKYRDYATIGCGKTKLLKQLIDFSITDSARISGKVLIDGENIYAPGVDVTEIRKKAGLLAQRPYPLPMSIYENVAYGLRIHNMKRGRALDEAVEHHLREAGLWEEVKDRLRAPATGLSIGQQQRLCLHEAWLWNPKCFWETSQHLPSIQYLPNTSSNVCLI